MMPASTILRMAFSMHAISASVKSHSRRIAFWTNMRRSLRARLQSPASKASSASASIDSSSTRVRTLLMQQKCAVFNSSLTVVFTTLIMTWFNSPSIIACTSTTMPSAGIAGIVTSATCSWLARSTESPCMPGASRSSGSGAGHSLHGWPSASTPPSHPGKHATGMPSLKHEIVVPFTTIS
eukprot:3331198-Rhodomonas_salina.1